MEKKEEYIKETSKRKKRPNLRDVGGLQYLNS
jgi:hypothetical protein